MTETQIDMFEEYEETKEDETDLDPLSDKDLRDVIVNATDWTVETILSQLNKGNIQLNPQFQRRDAWKEKRKSEFIESLLLGLPVPQIVLASNKEKKGKYIIIDGKQRLLSIRQFAASVDDKTFDQLKLTSLTVKKDLNGKSLDDLKAHSQYIDDVNAFENETLRTVVIKHWPSEEFLYRVFLRLNTNSVGLSPQELRQALHPGKFIDYAEETSGKSAAIKEILNIKKPDFRMRDVEIFVRYYAFRFFLNGYAGSLKQFLDTTCAELNSQWDEKNTELIQAADELEEAHSITKSIFGENAYKKWIKTKYESKFNRAIFDIMAFYFSKKEIAHKVQGREHEVEQAFKNLCERDTAFLSSIERTTKSVDATSLRLSKWAEALNSVLGTNLHVFSVHENRIV